MADQLSSDLAALRIERNPAPRQGGGRWVGRVIALALVLGAAFAGYSVGMPYLESKVFKTEVEITEIALVSPAQASVELTSTGYIVAQAVSKVAAKVPGKVIKANFREGAHINAGDVLFELDPSDVKAQIATAASQVAAAKARSQTTRAQLAEARVQLARAQALAKEGIGPKAAAEDAETRVTSLEAMVKASEAEASAANAAVAALNVTLNSFKVVAPLSGTVVNKPPEVGEMVAPQPAGIAVDMGGVEIADFSTLEVETDVPEQRLSQVKVGGPCEIVLDAYPTKRFRGKAHEITPRVNRTKATVTVKVAFVDDREGVMPDMAARVSFLSSELDKAELKAPPKIIVPSEAIATLGGAKVVYVVEDGKVRATPVELGPPFGSGFELARGPGAGTKLVKKPAAGLADGQRIKEKSAN
ncbi:MAG TPA: efflux RND transporter periplasmic adaptor subunit [Polyangiaceae bacterium]|nr:efflux RND transporter periplasmic adaptor subunit [Polyangiaceae bacterium]